MPRTRSNRHSISAATTVSGLSADENDAVRKGDGDDSIVRRDTSSPTKMEKGLKVGESNHNRKKRTVSDRSPALKSRKKTTTTSVTSRGSASTPAKDTVKEPAEKKNELKHNISGDDKENVPLTPGVTPYWKVAEERGRFSPRLTRSAKKSSRPSNIPRISDASPSKNTIHLYQKSPMRSSSIRSSSSKSELLDSDVSQSKSNGGLFQHEYSPPDRVKIEKEEKKKENDRREKLEKMTQQEGNVVFLSSGAEGSAQIRNIQEIENEMENEIAQSNATQLVNTKNKFCLDLSPEARRFRNEDHDRAFLVNTIKNLKMEVKHLKLNLDMSQDENIEHKMKMEVDGKLKGMDERITKLRAEMLSQYMLHKKNSNQQNPAEEINSLYEENAELRMTLLANYRILREHEQKRELTESSYRKIVDDFEGHHEKQKEMETIIASLRQENTSLRIEVEKLRNQQEEDSLKHERVIEELKVAQLSELQDAESVQDDKLNLSSELDGIVSGLENENTTTLTMSDREAEMTTMNDHLLKRCQTSEKEVEQKTIELEKLKENLSKQTAINHEVVEISEALEKEVNNMKVETKDLNERLSQQTSMNNQLTERYESAKNEVEQLKSEREQFQSSMQDKLSHGQNAADERIAKTNADMDKLRDKLTQTMELNSDLLEKNRLAEQSLAESKRRCEDLVNSVKEKETENCQLHEEKQLAERTNEHSKIEMISLEGTLAEVKEQRDDLENKNAELVGTMESNAIVYSAEKKELLDMVKDMEKKLALSETQSEKKLEQMNDRMKEEEQKSKNKLELLNVDLEEEKKNNERLNQQLFQVMEQFENERKQLRKLIAEKDFAVGEIQKRCKAMMKKMSTFNIRENDLCEKLLLQEEVRRSLHNKVMQLSGNIRVFIRVRPTLSNEDSNLEMPFSFPTIFDSSRSPSDRDVTVSDDLTKRFIVATEPTKDRGGLSQRQKKLKLGFDNVFDPSQKQEDVWKATEPLIQSAVDGYNVCVFAYGQTGSGKTYTMLGNDESPGVIRKSIRKLFNEKRALEEASKGAASAQISVELLEIYNEQVRDLLNEKKGTEGYENFNLALSSNEAVGNVVFEANHEEEVFSVLEKAQKRRCVKATKSNAESSRSHLIFSMNYIVTKASGVQRKSKLSICDLAGSERLSKSESYGSARKEAQHINKSLSTLSNVIEKLQQKSNHVPYRESKLTCLLHNSLGGDSKTLAIICCNPLGDHFQESTCSLRFAQKLNKVELKALGNISC